MPSTKSPKTRLHKWQFDAIGTRWSIETETKLDTKSRTEIMTIIADYDHVYSRFRKDSLVATIASKGKGDYHFPPESAELFDLYQSLYAVTNGSVTPLIGGLLEDAGYDASYSLQPKPLRTVREWGDVVYASGTRLTVKQPVMLDFGAAGKGQLVDMICRKLDTVVSVYVVDASGDIRVRGIPQKIGFEHPADTTMVVGSVEVQNGSICASSVNRRRWGEWHHVVDPYTKAPVAQVVATWVIAPTTLLADGLATALFFVDDSVLRKQFDGRIQTVRMLADGSIERSSNFVGELYV